ASSDIGASPGFCLRRASRTRRLVARPQGERRTTFTWLGTDRTPGQLVLFWMATLVSRVCGAPPTSTVKAAVTCRRGPITEPDATPVATPALSPLVMGVVVRSV